MNHYRISNDLINRGARVQSGFEDPIGPDYFWTGQRFQVPRPTGWYTHNLGERIGHWLESSQFFCIKGYGTWELEGPNFNSKDLYLLPSLFHLRSLALSNLSIETMDLKVLENIKNLRILAIADDSLDDSSVHYLVKLTNLKGLFLQSPNISKESVELLRAQLPECRIEYSGN